MKTKGSPITRRENPPLLLLWLLASFLSLSSPSPSCWRPFLLSFLSLCWRPSSLLLPLLLSGVPSLCLLCLLPAAYSPSSFLRFLLLLSLLLAFLPLTPSFFSSPSLLLLFSLVLPSLLSSPALLLAISPFVLPSPSLLSCCFFSLTRPSSLLLLLHRPPSTSIFSTDPFLCLSHSWVFIPLLVLPLGSPLSSYLFSSLDLPPSSRFLHLSLVPASPWSLLLLVLLVLLLGSPFFSSFFLHLYLAPPCLALSFFSSFSFSTWHLPPSPRLYFLLLLLVPRIVCLFRFFVFFVSLLRLDLLLFLLLAPSPFLLHSAPPSSTSFFASCLPLFSISLLLNSTSSSSSSFSFEPSSTSSSLSSPSSPIPLPLNFNSFYSFSDTLPPPPSPVLTLSSPSSSFTSSPSSPHLPSPRLLHSFLPRLPPPLPLPRLLTHSFLVFLHSPFLPSSSSSFASPLLVCEEIFSLDICAFEDSPCIFHHYYSVPSFSLSLPLPLSIRPSL
ncbi:hypothetical protein C7M84_010377 [Penaeus vannamei]|uniref:Uncharacterized protein n=1 Tax=Penaeus vannamei TaxID=6689 RepID=A0A423T4L3_PENVA|nr:hypothetical protein C7M84_010377 [Penaeus vannamei]